MTIPSTIEPLQNLCKLDKPVHYLVYRPRFWDESLTAWLNKPDPNEAIVLMYKTEKYWREMWGRLLADGEHVLAGVTTLRQMLGLPEGRFEP